MAPSERIIVERSSIGGLAGAETWCWCNNVPLSESGDPVEMRSAGITPHRLEKMV